MVFCNDYYSTILRQWLQNNDFLQRFLNNDFHTTKKKHDLDLIFNDFCTMIYIQRSIYNDLYTTINLQRFVYNDLYTTINLQRFVYNDLYTTICIQRFVYNDYFVRGYNDFSSLPTIWVALYENSDHCQKPPKIVVNWFVE